MPGNKLLHFLIWVPPKAGFTFLKVFLQLPLVDYFYILCWDLSSPKTLLIKTVSRKLSISMTFIFINLWPQFLHLHGKIVQMGLQIMITTSICYTWVIMSGLCGYSIWKTVLIWTQFMWTGPRLICPSASVLRQPIIWK